MTMLRRFVSRLRTMHAHRELAEEIETHRQLTEQRLRESGMSAAQAATESRRVMGNVTLAQEDARAEWLAPWIDGVLQDIGYAFRILRRSPAFAAAMIIVVALGIGTTTAVFGLLDGLVLRSLPVAAPDRLVYFRNPAFSNSIFFEVRARGTAIFSSVAAWNVERRNVTWGQELEPTHVLRASGSFYSMLGIHPAVGRTFGEDDDRIGGGRDGPVAVISHTAWQRRFSGDPAVIGRTVRIENDAFTIVGVTPGGFFGVSPGLAPDVTIPLLASQRPVPPGVPISSSVHLMGRLRDGISLNAANVALQTFWPAVLEATTDRSAPSERRALYLARSTALERGHAGYSSVRNQFKQPLWLLLGLVALLLTVACASAANLLLARSTVRQREVAVRLAIGASGARLVRQMLTETLVWTALASAAGLFLAYWAVEALVSLLTTSQQPIVLSIALNWRVLTFSIVLALITAAICSVAPALRMTRLHPATTLKNTGQIAVGLFGRWSLAKSLVAWQIALTVLLLFGASLFGRSLNRVLGQDPGFDRTNVLIVATDAEAAGYKGERLAGFFDQLLERLRNVPGVESASLSMYPPISDDDGAWTRNIALDGEPVPAAPGPSYVYFNFVSPDYFRTIGMPVVRGRDFGSTDGSSSTRVAIVNEALERRFFPNQDAIGRRITIGLSKTRQDLQIVGIVKNAKYQRLEEDSRAIAYLPRTQHASGNLFAEVRLNTPASAAADAIRRELRAIDSVVPIRFETVTDRIRESLVTRRVIALLATALGIAALVLACAGVYGVLADAVSRKTRELGLRLALGADRTTVLRMVMTESAMLAVVGIAAGVAAAMFVGRFAKDLLYQVSPRDPASLTAAAIVMLLVAALAAFIPARRAARVDPVVALRCE
jgi:putative ABC transport system permease protein